ncbi:MAG TPA: ABC transporter permease [bacterium]|nr:ABC transporter permease [bacterium]
MNPTISIAAHEPAEFSTTRRWVIGTQKFFKEKPLGAAGLVVMIVFLLMAALANWISPYDPLTMHYADILAPPSARYWLGTDSFGRDILTRIIYGARTAMLIGYVCAFVGATGGMLIGVATAYFGGKLDNAVQRLLDILLSFPLIILAMAIVAVMGTGTENLIFAITIPMIPRCARVIRSAALSLRESPYVDAARALGFSRWRIILRHMMPNVVAPYLIMLTSFMGQAILLAASLSFLGLGVQEPVPDWGLMLQGGAELYAETAPWLPFFPGLAITISVFAFNLFGDSLRDVLDPKLRV